MTPFRERFAKLSLAPDQALSPTGFEQLPPLAPVQAQMEGAESGSTSAMVSTTSSGASLADRFAEALTQLGGTVTPCSLTELAERILEALRAEGIQEIQAWDEGLPAGFRLRDQRSRPTSWTIPAIA